MQNKFARSFLISLAVAGTTFPLIGQAGGTSVNGASARSESTQAFTAVANDPSAIYYNPAGLTQLKGQQVQGDLTYTFPDMTYKNSNNGVSTRSIATTLGPNFYYTNRLNQKWAFGVGLYAPFQRRSRYRVNAAVMNLPQKAETLRVDLVPTFAYQINPYVSVGAGFVMSYVKIDANMFGLNESGDGYGTTGQAGMLIKLPKGFKVGLNYRGQETARVTGWGQLTGADDTFTANLRFPATASIGLAWQVNPKWLISTAYENELWQYVKQVKRDYNNPVFDAISTNTYNGKDSNDYRAGVIYRQSKQNEFRAGYSYIQAAIPEAYIAPAQPDYDVNVYSIGYSRYYNKFRLDLGYEYAHSPVRKGTNALVPGDYQLNANLFLIGLNYQLA